MFCYFTTKVIFFIHFSRQSRPSVSSDSSEQSSNAELSLSPSPPTTSSANVQDHHYQEFDPSWKGILRKTESKINLNE